MRPPLQVPASLNGDALLNELRGHESQLAVVIDEYGGTAGGVSTEDLVEELVGQVVDEHDGSKVPEVLVLSDGSWSASGRLHKDTFTEFGFDVDGGHYDTIAGLLLEQLGRIPDTGESVVIDGWRLTVTRMDGHRIDRVLLTPPDERPPADERKTS
jgi:CBS domain containing-hemolysin-like protein